MNLYKALKVTQQIIGIYLHLIDTENYQIMVILKMRIITGIMKNQRKLSTQTKPTQVKRIIMTLGKNQQINNPSPSKNTARCKEI